jgi:hypothetical protein
MTIIFKGLPDQLFGSLCNLVVACSSEEHRFTIHIEDDSITYYHPNVVNAEHMDWLQQHVNVEMAPSEDK